MPCMHILLFIHYYGFIWHLRSWIHLQRETKLHLFIGMVLHRKFLIFFDLNSLLGWDLNNKCFCTTATCTHSFNDVFLPWRFILVKKSVRNKRYLHCLHSLFIFLTKFQNHKKFCWNACTKNVQYSTRNDVNMLSSSGRCPIFYKMHAPKSWCI